MAKREPATRTSELDADANRELVQGVTGAAGAVVRSLRQELGRRHGALLRPLLRPARRRRGYRRAVREDVKVVVEADAQVLRGPVVDTELHRVHGDLAV